MSSQYRRINLLKSLTSWSWYGQNGEKDGLEGRHGEDHGNEEKEIDEDNNEESENESEDEKERILDPPAGVDEDDVYSDDWVRMQLQASSDVEMCNRLNVTSQDEVWDRPDMSDAWTDEQISGWLVGRVLEQQKEEIRQRTGGDGGGMRVHRTNSLGKQISNIKDKVGSTTPQIISRLSDTLKTKNPSMEAIIEDHARLQKQVTELRTQLDKMSTISLFCGGKMDLYISLLQDCLLKHETCGELEVHSFAGLKQVRDILKDGLENCGTVPDYEEDFRDIDEHIADASHNQQLTTDNTADDEKVKITTLSETLSLVQADSRATGTSHECEPTLSSESCECDENLDTAMLSSSDEPVEVMYFDHSSPSLTSNHDIKPPPNVDVIYEQSNHAHNKVKKKDGVADGVTSQSVGLSEGAGISDPLFSSHMYDEVKNELKGGVNHEGELNGVVGDGDGGSPSPPPTILVDPLTSFQIDLHDDTF